MGLSVNHGVRKARRVTQFWTKWTETASFWHATALRIMQCGKDGWLTGVPYLSVQ